MNSGSSISALVMEYQSLKLHDIIDHDKFLYYALTFHSTSIEGSTLTLQETRLLLEEGLTPGGKPLEHSQMVKDHYEALLFTVAEAQKNTPVSADLIREIHAKVMKTTGNVYNTPLGTVHASQGEYRKGNVSAGGHYFVSYDKVPALVKALTALSEKKAVAVSTIEQKLDLAFTIHYELVTIHPFYDGNGRTSRLLMNFLLERMALPLAILYKEDKASYYEALATGQQGGDKDVFIRFMYNQYQKHLEEEISRFRALNREEN